MRRILPCLLALSLLAGGVAAGPASASSRETVYFEAPRDLLAPQTRANAFAALQSLGVHALRVVLYWKTVAPAASSPSKPHFDATNPASYNWAQYPQVVFEAHQLGWKVLLDVSGPVPRWATQTRRDNLTNPRASEFRAFVTAVARQFGSWVDTWSIWNEADHPAFLDPQYAHGRPVSPSIYRGLVLAGFQGFHDAGVSSPRVLIGDTAPTGTTRDVAPLAFLRGLLCLDQHYHRVGHCAELPIAGYAHHAYTKPIGPSYIPPNGDDVTIGSLSRLSRALDLAARAGAIPRGTPIYLTEFGTQSKPNPYLGVSLVQQAEFDAIAEHIAWSNGRVAAFSQYLLRDDPIISVPGSSVLGLGPTGFQTGLELANGRPKPSFNGFRLPLVVQRRGSGYSLWGLARPANGATTVTVMVQPLHSRRWKVLAASVPTDSAGYWTMRSTTPGSWWQVMWKSPTGTTYSGATVRAY